MALAKERIVARVTKVNGVVLQISQAGDPGTVYLETKDIDAGAPGYVKFLNGLIMDLPAAALVNSRIKIYVRDDLSESLVQVADESLLGVEYPLPLRPPDSVYFRIRFEDNAVTVPWTLGRLDLFGGVVAEVL